MEKRPNGRLRHNPLSRPVQEIVHAAHAKVHEVEQENVGVEAGHKGEVLTERGIAYGKGKVRAVFALIIAADKRNGVSVLLFQRLQRGIVRHILHCHAAVYGERGKPLGVDDSIHRIRPGGDILRARLDQIMEAPKKVGVIFRTAAFFLFRTAVFSLCGVGSAVTLHPSIQRLIARCYTDGLRQGNANRLAADGGDLLFIVI